MAHRRAAVLLFLVATLGVVVAGELTGSNAGRQLQQAIVPQLTERVIFDPNQGENNKVQGYIGDVYVGEVNFAEADPAAAGVGAGAKAGIALTYDKTSYFDEEYPKSRADIGPGARAVGAAVARILGIATGKAAARVQGKFNQLSYRRDAFDDNSISLGTVNELGGAMSAGAFLDRVGDNDALLEPTRVNNVIGRR